MLADIADYSALMEREETRTFARLHELREQIVNPKVAEYGGRIVKTTGDGFLAEFPSATAALGIRHRHSAHEFRQGSRLRTRPIGSVCASVSMSATSSSTATTFPATASMSRPDWSRWPRRTDFACQPPFATRSGKTWASCWRTSASSTSRTSRGRSGPSGSIWRTFRSPGRRRAHERSGSAGSRRPRRPLWLFSLSQAACLLE